jgi:hypothetical protein
MAVPFKELAGSPKGTWSAKGPKFTREILVLNENKLAMIRELLGTSYVYGSTRRAFFPGIACAIVDTVDEEPFVPLPGGGEFTDITTDLATYVGRYTKLTINYVMNVADAGGVPGGTEPQPEDDTRGTLTYSLNHAGENIECMPGGVVWEDDSTIPVPPDAGIPFKVSTSDHILTWSNAENPPWDSIEMLKGCVNSTTFIGKPAGTLLFDGATAEKTFKTLDELYNPQYDWQLTYVFKSRLFRAFTYDAQIVTVGWQHTWRSKPDDKAGWYRLKVQGSSPATYRYPEVDFSALFPGWTF